MKKTFAIATVFLGLAVLVSLAAPAPSAAVANPLAINWRGDPLTFITSLYMGVLGRPPESQQVVADWAR